MVNNGNKKKPRRTLEVGREASSEAKVYSARAGRLKGVAAPLGKDSIASVEEIDRPAKV